VSPADSAPPRLLGHTRREADNLIVERAANSNVELHPCSFASLRSGADASRGEELLPAWQWGFGY
jgi:hypothetical protein